MWFNESGDLKPPSSKLADQLQGNDSGPLLLLLLDPEFLLLKNIFCQRNLGSIL